MRAGRGKMTSTCNGLVLSAMAACYKAFDLRLIASLCGAVANVLKQVIVICR